MSLGLTREEGEKFRSTAYSSKRAIISFLDGE